MRPLVPFTSLTDLLDPYLHINIGLTNNQLSAIRKSCQELDQNNEVVNLELKENLIRNGLEKVSNLQQRQEIKVGIHEFDLDSNYFPAETQIKTRSENL